jgi:KDO2-lipid IV(A) lauroyltransferase
MIPLRLSCFVAGKIFLLYFYYSKRHRERTISHILHSGIVSNRKSAIALAKKNYSEYAKIAVEIIRMKKMVSENFLESNIKFTGREEDIKRFISEPLIIVTGHLGNWEMAGLIYTLKAKRDLLSVMRPMSNPKLERFFYNRGEGCRHSSCSKDGAVRHLLKAVKSGKSIAIVSDQHASSKEGVEVEFFGQPARAHTSPSLMHLKTGLPIFVIAVLRTEEPLHFEYRVLPPIEYKPTGDKEKDVRAVTQMYTSGLQKIIEEKPEQWLWIHRRWLNINRGDGSKN